MAKGMALIKAYKTEAIPDNGGFIISAFFEPGTNYGIYEITAYRNVKDIYETNEGLVFKTDGNRMHILVEPPAYAKKYIEPVNREDDKSIPYRFDELDIHTTKKVEKIMISIEPKMLYSSFTVLKKESDAFSFIFYPTKDVFGAIVKFVTDSMYNDSNLSRKDSIEIAKKTLEVIKKFTIWAK